MTESAPLASATEASGARGPCLWAIEYDVIATADGTGVIGMQEQITGQCSVASATLCGFRALQNVPLSPALDGRFDLGALRQAMASLKLAGAQRFLIDSTSLCNGKTVRNLSARIAVKTLACSSGGLESPKPAAAAAAWHEVAIMRQVCKPGKFVIGLDFIHHAPSRIIVGMEWAGGGDLYNLLQHVVLDEKQARFYIAEIMLALEHMHGCGVIHGDIKPENVLIGSDGHIRLCDFGLSTLLRPSEHRNEQTGRVEVVSHSGTLPYCAPEILKREPHGPESDWWSLGIVAFEMVFGTMPFFDEDEQQTCVLICTAPVPIPQDCVVDPQFAVLLESLLVKSRQARLGYAAGFGEVASHAWLSQVDWEQCRASGCEPPFLLQEGKPVSSVG